MEQERNPRSPIDYMRLAAAASSAAYFAYNAITDKDFNTRLVCVASCLSSLENVGIIVYTLASNQQYPLYNWFAFACSAVSFFNGHSALNLGTAAAERAVSRSITLLGISSANLDRFRRTVVAEALAEQQPQGNDAEQEAEGAQQQRQHGL